MMIFLPSIFLPIRLSRIVRKAARQNNLTIVS